MLCYGTASGTGGERESFSIDRWHMPKRDLVEGLAVLLESSGLQIAAAGVQRRFAPGVAECEVGNFT